MRTIIYIFLFCGTMLISLTTVAGQAKTKQKVEPLGYFANVKSDGEHQSGFSFRLWKSHDAYYGVVSGSPSLRLMGDPPRAMFESAVNGQISFRTRVLAAIVIDSVGTTERWETYEFSGSVGAKVVRGTMTITRDSCKTDCTSTTKVVLRRRESWSKDMEIFSSVSDWKKKIAEKYRISDTK